MDHQDDKGSSLLQRDKTHKICSQHFRRSEYTDPGTSKNAKNVQRCPLYSSGLNLLQTILEDAIRPAVKNLEACPLEEEEATDTASEGEGDVLYSLRPQILSRETQTYKEHCCDEIDPLPCSNQSFVSHSLLKCVTKKKEEKLLMHSTGFDSHKTFSTTLEFLLPNLDRRNIFMSVSHSLRRVALHHSAGVQGALHLLYNQFGS